MKKVFHDGRNPQRVEAGCHTKTIQQDMFENDRIIEGNICIVQDGAKCQEAGIEMFSYQEFRDVSLQDREGCCDHDAPFPRMVRRDK